MTRILVTGAAGFIGYHTAERLLNRGDEVMGVDNLNTYYDVELKQARVERLRRHSRFTFRCEDIGNADPIATIFAEFEPEIVIHLAAQAGVRSSQGNPDAYIRSNVSGFVHVLEASRQQRVGHLVYASSSSVYGANTNMPFSVRHNVDHPLTLYAATKKANELMSHTYSHLYGLPTTGLRFFSVYGPWGRPDMALFLFTEAILSGRPIDVFNHGRMQRDFTYVDDIVDGLVRVADQPAKPNPEWSGDNPDPATSTAPWKIYNIGNSEPVDLLRYIEIIEQCVGRRALKNMLPLQPGDIPAAWADITEVVADTGYAPTTSVEVGVRRFVDWYLEYSGRRGSTTIHAPQALVAAGHVE
jgi:UDP-glucuronate 4-epimerase